MPDISFIISGTGSTQFVLDWALSLGYIENIEETSVEFILKNIFEHAKNMVKEYRLIPAVTQATNTITSTIESDLSGISMEM